MKTFRFIGMALFAVLMCVNFASCSNENEIVPNEPQKPKEYTVSLGFTGDISISESPLSRTTEKETDLYGFIVLSKPTNEENNAYTNIYAYGLFDDVSNLNIKLLEGYKYKFVSTMVVNGTNVIFWNPSNEFKSYGLPFRMLLKNAFTYSEAGCPYEYNLRFSDSSTGSTYNITHSLPIADRYYGELLDFKPSDESNKANIYMERTVFGAKFVSENLNEGKLKIEMTGAALIELTPDKTQIENIYTISPNSAYGKGEISVSHATTITWEKSDGAIVPLGEFNLTFKRNKMTTVTIKVNDMSAENGIGITLDDEEMTEGDNITIENGKIIDTNVNTGTEE